MNASLNKISSFRTIALSAVSLIALTTPVLAQEATVPDADESATTLGDVVVTARRVSERLQEVPVAVSAVNAQMLRDNNISRVQDLKVAVPSLQIGPSATGSGLPSIQIRGQAQSRSVIGQDPSVAVYVADFANTVSIGLNQSLFDVESVQVLRGPQGTLFGKNTTGGALLVTPVRPSTSGDSAWVSGEVSNYDGRTVQGAFNAALTDHVALRVAGTRQVRDGYVINLVDGRDYYDEDNWSVRASLLLTSDRVENLTIVDRFESDTHNAVGIAQYGRPGSPADLLFPGPDGFLAAIAAQQLRDPTRVMTAPVSFARAEAWGAINTTTVNLNDNLTLKNIAGYRKVESSQVLDLVGLTVPVGLFSPTDDRAEWYSDELQLIGEYDTVSWIAGLYYYAENGVNDAPFRALVTSPASPLQLLGGSADNVAYSAFAQGTYKFGGAFDRLSMTAGLRYTVDERETTGHSRIIAPYELCLVEDENGVRLPFDACERTESETFKEPTYNLSLEYKATDKILTYVAHRRGYRTGGFNIRATRDAQFAPFQPEIVQDIEVGVKADWSVAGMPIRTNLALYRQYYDDIQRNVNVILSLSPRATGTNVINAASAEIQGLEFDGSIRPLPGLTLTGAFAYTDAKYDEFVDDLGNDLSNNRFYLVPEQVASLSASYELPVDASLGDMKVVASYFKQTSFAISDDNEGYIAPGYELWNARFDWDHVMGSPLNLSVFGRNLTDERFVTGGDSKTAALGYRSTFLGEPRMYGLQARWDF